MFLKYKKDDFIWVGLGEHLPAQDEVLVHVVHVILQERVDLGWLGSCCNHLREKIIKGSAWIY